MPAKVECLFVAVLFTAYCGACSSTEETPDSGENTTDTGSDDGLGELGDASAALRIPDPPVFTPCPEGWREVESEVDEDFITCDPWPESGRQDCAVGQAHFLGETACRTIGQPCPNGDWADDLPTDQTIVYVHALAAVEGTGAQDSPFGSIAEAVAASESGTVIALSKGTFDELIELSAGLTLHGACVAETVIAPTVSWTPPDQGGPYSGTIDVVGTGAVIQNLTVTGQLPAITVQQTGSVHLEGILIDGAIYSGLAVGGGTATGNDVVIVDTQLFADFGLAVGVFEGANVELSNAIFDGNGPFTVFVLGSDSFVNLERVAVLDSVPGQQAGMWGAGVLVETLAEATISQAYFEENPGGAFVITRSEDEGEPAEINLTVSDTVLVRSAVDLLEGSHAEFQRTLIEFSQGVGIQAMEADLALTDVVIRDAQPFTDESDRYNEPGYGLFLFDSNADLSRVWLLRNQGVSLVGWGTRTEITGEDVVIDETAAMECLDCDEKQESVFGVGLVVMGNGSTQLSRFRVSGNVMAGIQLVSGGVADLQSGEVSYNLIGVNLQTEPFDIERLQDDVIYFENERNLDSELLPVPGTEWTETITDPCEGELREVVHRWTYTYDEDGNRLTEEWDDNVDGVDSRTTYTYQDGRLTTEEWDHDADGTTDGGIIYTYDDDGNLILAEEDDGFDGTIEGRTIYSYDEDGNLSTESRDWDNDGTLDAETTFTYDDNRNCLTVETEHDLTSYTYDLDGRVLTETSDYEKDDVVDLVITYTYDDGRLVLTETDWDVDGVADETTTFTYDPDGNLISKYVDRGEYYSYSTNERTTYTYEQDGRRVTEEIDYGDDGMIDMTVVTIYDEEGHLSSQTNTSIIQDYCPYYD